MNQAPTREEPIQKRNQTPSVHLCNRKGGIDESSPYKKRSILRVVPFKMAYFLGIRAWPHFNHK